MVYAGIVPRIDPSLEDEPRLRSLIRRMGFPSPGS
jgi:hypothetical protein